jgi:hypothetical protein
MKIPQLAVKKCPAIHAKKKKVYVKSQKVSLNARRRIGMR